jgi:hypothetical protein
MKGIVPPSLASPATHSQSGEQAWQQLVKRCETNDECARNFPKLRTELPALLRRLDEQPMLDLKASSNGASKIRVTPGLFAEGFRTLLYAPDSAARIPSFLNELAEGNRSRLVDVASAARLLVSGERLAAGFFLSVSCTEDVPYLPKNLASLVAGTFGGDYRLQQQIRACEVWTRGKVSPQHRQPTKSAVPTLLMSGEFDPVTPPAGGDEVLRGLSRGVHVVIRNNGHPIGIADKCIAAMMGQLLDRGSASDLDRACADRIPAASFVLRK